MPRGVAAGRARVKFDQAVNIGPTIGSGSAVPPGIGLCGHFNPVVEVIGAFPDEIQCERTDADSIVTKVPHSGSKRPPPSSSLDGRVTVLTDPEDSVFQLVTQ